MNEPRIIIENCTISASDTPGLTIEDIDPSNIVINGNTIVVGREGNGIRITGLPKD